MEYVFIVGAVQAFFFSILAFNKQNKSKGDYVMILWFVLLGVMLVAYSLEVIGIDDRYPILWGFTTSLPMLVGPITYIYVLTYAKGDKKISPLNFLHALPYMIFTVIVLIKMNVYPEATVRGDIKFIEDDGNVYFLVLGLLRIFLGPLYLAISFWVWKKHKKRIGKYFSYTENIDLKWFSHLLLMTLLIWVNVIIMSFLSNFNDFIPWRLGDNLIYLMVTITVLINGYYGIKQQIIFSPSLVKPDPSDPKGLSENKKAQYLNSSLTQKESAEYLKNLLHLMDDEKPYLDGKLSLKDVAEKLNISTNHLSQVINENLNKNFFDFVNSYRVDFVKQKMSDPSSKNLTLLGMAYDSGFNSKSSFNSIFKKVTDLTPSQYLKSIS